LHWPAGGDGMSRGHLVALRVTLPLWVALAALAWLLLP